VPFHVAGAGPARGVVENRQLLADLNNRRQADAFLGPTAVLSVKDNRLVLRVPFVQILAPINPDRVGVLAAVDTNVIGEQEPRLVVLFVVDCGVSTVK
jgi:hypothetical protein